MRTPAQINTRAAIYRIEASEQDIERSSMILGVAAASDK
jgi:hypothetical protein